MDASQDNTTHARVAYLGDATRIAAIQRAANLVLDLEIASADARNDADATHAERRSLSRALRTARAKLSRLVESCHSRPA